MMRNLSPNQFKVLEFIHKCVDREGVSPTYREIAGHFGYRSPKAAFDHVRALEKKGYVVRRPRLSRGIGIPSIRREFRQDSIAMPILGQIPAGSPDVQAEHRIGMINVDPGFLGEVADNKFFVLRVKGESMTGRGIYDGDLVVVDGDRHPKEKDIVVALIDGENTIKTLAKQGERFVLKAENPKFPDLIPTEEMSTQGVVIAVLRKLK